MEKIKKYIERFTKNKEIDAKYELTVEDMRAFIGEMQFSDANKLFYSINTLFQYSFIKGYRAAKKEMKKRGVA